MKIIELIGASRIWLKIRTLKIWILHDTSKSFRSKPCQLQDMLNRLFMFFRIIWSISHEFTPNKNSELRLRLPWLPPFRISAATPLRSNSPLAASRRRKTALSRSWNRTVAASGARERPWRCSFWKTSTGGSVWKAKGQGKTESW